MNFELLTAWLNKTPANRSQVLLLMLKYPTHHTYLNYTLPFSIPRLSTTVIRGM